MARWGQYFSRVKHTAPTAGLQRPRQLDHEEWMFAQSMPHKGAAVRASLSRSVISRQLSVRP
jgi:hypothetical protein